LNNASHFAVVLFFLRSLHLDHIGTDICLDISSPSGEVESWFDDVIAAKNRLENLLGDPGWPSQTREDLEGRLTPDEIATSLPLNGVEDLYVAVKVANETFDGESK